MIYDKNGRKLRSWDSAVSKWTLSKVGEDYYKEIGGSEWVVSIPCHYVIAKPNDEQVSYKGYSPVSQLRTGLQEKLTAFVRNQGRAARAEQIKRLY